MSGAAGRFGYVHFDFLDLPREGWLARHGEEARRIRSPAEIPSDGLFWCNLDWQHFHRGSSLGRMGHLRHASYLPIRPNDVLLELGLDADLLGVEETTGRLARCFGNVMAWASRLIAAVAPDLPEERRFTRGTLRDDFAIMFPSLEYPRGDEVHALVEGQSFHTISSTLVPYRKEALRIIVRRPRLRHALDVLASPSPTGPYRYVLAHELGDVNDVVERAQPALCKIRLREPSDAVFDLYGFANTLARDRRSFRSWAAHPELDALRRMAEVELDGGWVGRTYRPLGSVLPEAVDPLLNARPLRVSWAVGICAETLWRAALLPPERPRGAKGFQARQSGDISWQGLWARAADKLTLFPAVRALSERGYDVSSYGFGWILCAVDEARLDEFMEDVATLGLLPRIQDLRAARALTSWGGARLDQPYASLVYGRDTDRIMAADAIAAAEPDEHARILGEVFGQEKTE